MLRSATLWLVHNLVSIFWGTWALAGVQIWCFPSTTRLGLTTAALTCCCDASNDRLMNVKHNAGLHNSRSPRDVATKNYVVISPEKFYFGHISIPEASLSRLGIIASSSSSYPVYKIWGTFNNLNTAGVNGSLTANTIPSWLQIQCPETVKNLESSIRM